MHTKFKKLLLHWRIILLVACIVLSLFLISPNFSEGVAIRNVIQNSSASVAGVPQPNPNIKPVDREKIISINNRPIKDVNDYHDYLSTIGPNRTIQVKTTRSNYKITTRGKDGKSEDIGLRVYEAPTTNIRKGLDLQGGTRVLLQTEVKLNEFDLDTLIENMKQRLNVYGLSDIVIRDSSDLTGNQYIVVEIAGATEEEIKDLLARQGKFEAKIGNKTVFKGGGDILYVGRTARDSRIETCNSGQGQYSCDFSFAITLSQEAAQRQADITNVLEIVAGQNGNVLSEKLDFFLDDVLVSSLNIVADLKGKAETQIAISGSELGNTREQAVINTQAEMKRLQTILITGSLPVKLNIVKTDAISPALGDEFVRNALLMGLISFLAVSLIIFIKYRKILIVVPILVTMVSEVVILLGIAALIGSNIDLAAIAGILITIGTGVNDQIVMTDEILRKEAEANISNWKEKVKRAFLIILLAYFTVVVAMFPLMLAGAGLLKGFAITTIIGLTVGILVTRPAYAVFVEMMLK